MERHSTPPNAVGWQHSQIQFGCDYNPEQWPLATRIDDVTLMQEAGVTIVAINIFGWASVEPRSGEFDFDTLDHVIELLHAGGIQVNLGTGTSSPPPWLTTLHPEILPTAADGTTRWPGGRQAWCPSSPVFRERALQLVEKTAERYGSHPAVALWHVSNELGCHNAHCYCDASALAFRAWLETRYSTIDALNEAWGTTFWSQRYSTWEEILPPRITLSASNPAQKLDFCRFSSDELLDYYRAEADIVRATGDIPVTTNFMVTAHIRNLDYWQWAPNVDIIANDHYLDHRLANPTSELAFSADLTRGLANGTPWILMEHSTSAVSWQPHNVAKLPGEMLRNSLTQVARGADGVCFFQWRASRQGAEKFHSAMLPHAGTDSKIWRETLELGRALRALSGVVGTRVEASVAMVFSWQAWWATEGDAMPSTAVRYLEQVHVAYEAARAAGVTVDFVPPGADLSGYSAVIVPCLYLISDADAASLSTFVGDGGTALFTFFSGLADESDSLRVDGSGAQHPGAFTELLGLWTEEFFPLLPESLVAVSGERSASVWTELVRPTTAQTVATYESGPVAGAPALTRNSHGSGTAWYVSTQLAATDYASFMRDILEGAGVVTGSPGSELERVVRSNGSDRFSFLINHSAKDITVSIAGMELLTDTEFTETLTVPAGLVRVVHSTLAEKEEL
jgi:beta-galactosidase